MADLSAAALTLSADLRPGDREAVVDGLVRYNTAHGFPGPWRDLDVVLRDRAGAVRGGALAETNAGWCFLKALWVDDPLRGRGFGRRLLAAVGDGARERGCLGVYLDTYSFQARPFYERAGYAVFGTLPDHPPGGAKYYLAKRLVDVGPDVAVDAGAVDGAGAGDGRAGRLDVGRGVHEPEIRYGDGLPADAFLALAGRVWPRAYDRARAAAALARTANVGAWVRQAGGGDRLVGAVRVLTDGYFFATVPEILVDPAHRRRGVGRALMDRALAHSPRGVLAFAAQPPSVGFFERLGCARGLTGFTYGTPRPLGAEPGQVPNAATGEGA